MGTMRNINENNGILKLWNWDFLFPLLSKSKKYLHENTGTTTLFGTGGALQIDSNYHFFPGARQKIQ